MSKGKLLAVCIVWLMLVGIGAVAWRFFIEPQKQLAAEKEREAQIETTSGQSRYRATVNLGLDPFSGYAVLRSPAFQDSLRDKSIRVQLVDDQADYGARIRKLQQGEIQMAAFTIDALVKACAQIDDLPGVIVAILDETRGADAMVANKQQFPNVDSLNHPDVRFVLTADSPSETLARVVISQFHLDQLNREPFVLLKTPEQTFARYRESKPSSREVFVLWEPFVSQMLENETMHVVIDSSRFRGYIVDVLVVSRDFLSKNESIVQEVVGSYFAAAYQHRGDMLSLVRTDAEQQQLRLTPAQAEKLVAGVHWKNTIENFAHFGILEERSRQHIEDMIANITGVLTRTGAIRKDPTEGSPAKLFNQRILQNLRATDFHPGLQSETLEQEGTTLPVLSGDDWTNLREIGELNVPPLVFARGTAQLQPSSQVVLDELVRTLNTWPQYYVLIKGDATRRGNVEANRQLAEQRAKAAADYLVQRGIHQSRVHAVAVEPTGEASVSFVLGEAPY